MPTRNARRPTSRSPPHVVQQGASASSLPAAPARSGAADRRSQTMRRGVRNASSAAQLGAITGADAGRRTVMGSTATEPRSGCARASSPTAQLCSRPG